MDKLNLEKKLRQYDESYYHGLTPLITDAEYDELVDRYELIYGPYIKQSKQTDKLPIHAPSMKKIKSKSKIEQWDENHPGDKILSDKIDVMSLIIDYTNMTIYTHSDATHGNNISHLLSYFNIPKQKMNFKIRGELTIKLSTFEKYKDKYVSPRNIISGVINQKTPSDIIKDFTFLAFQVETDEPLTPEEQFIFAEKHGFDIVPGIKKVSHLNYDDLKSDLEDKCDYPRDGKTIALNVYESYTESLPENKIVFKIIGETAETTVIDIEWNESRKCLLKPRINIVEVFLDNAKLNWTSGFNAKFIQKYNIGPGTILLMTRSGSINPYILEVIEGTKATLPEGTWDKTETNLVSPINDNVMIKRIHYFFEVLGSKFLGLKIVGKIYQYHSSIVEFLTLTTEDLLKIPGFKIKGAQRIINTIQDCIRNMTLAKLMYGSSIFYGLGEIKIEAILNAVPQLYDMIEDKPCHVTLEDLKISGIDKLGESFLKELPEFIEFLDELDVKKYLRPIKNINNVYDENIITPPIIYPEYKGLPMKGMVIVFSGDKKLTNQAKSLGAIVDKNVTKRTTLLIVDQVGTMNNKEKECTGKGIKIKSLKDFKLEYGL